ncbi:2'-5' RNA ligase family protein, partial [Nonomuraea sp. NPDC001023]|uniref:2'-5' RNA ligase family protein n=1 Tax=Nonomuraea sp. NPDC001023 TaxID=3154770 RepID=UPI0033256976
MRLFAAVVPPEEALDEVERAVAPYVGQVPGLRWAGRPTWHVTLAFYGEVPERALPDLRVRLERAAHRHHSTLTNALTIGIPAFFLALAPTVERARPGFV